MGRQGRGWVEAFLSSHSHPIICVSANTRTHIGGQLEVVGARAQEWDHLCLTYCSAYRSVSERSAAAGRQNTSPVSASFAPWQQLELKLLPQ